MKDKHLEAFYVGLAMGWISKTGEEFEKHIGIKALDVIKILEKIIMERIRDND